MQELEKVVSIEKLEELTTINPTYIIKNKEFNIQEPIKIKTGFFH